jgi:selenocysteine-specific elongation factor
MIVATAGHIDHGKTSLVRALTGVDTDRHPEEKRRGISIDLGFAHLASPGQETIGFIDVPGHERFLHNMLSGISGIHAGMLVVAADDGVMPQTSEHLRVLELLNTPAALIVINKADRVDGARIEEVQAQLDALTREGPFAFSPRVVVSARTGEGLPELRAELTRLAAARASREHDEDLAFRMTVDRCFVIKGMGVVATGTVLAGRVVPGDELRVAPAGLAVRVRSLQSHGTSVESAARGDRVAVRLSGAETKDLHRGDWLVTQEAFAPTAAVLTEVTLLAGAPAVRNGSMLHIHIGARSTTARLACMRGSGLLPGTRATVRLHLQGPITCWSGDHLVLRDSSAQHTIGGGIVIDPVGAARRNLPGWHEVLRQPSFQMALAELASSAPHGFDVSRLAKAYGATAEAVERGVQRLALLTAGAAHQMAIGRAAAELVGRSSQPVLEAFHASAPDMEGMPLSALARGLDFKHGQSLLAAILRTVGPTVGIELVGGKAARLATHQVDTSALADPKFLSIEKHLEDKGPVGAGLHELCELTRLPRGACMNLLFRGMRFGRIDCIADKRWFRRQWMQRHAAAACACHDETRGQFTTAQFRDRAGVGRNLAVEILEHFDRKGFTVREGELRRLRDRAGYESPAEIQ